jgi:hypothetical protein
MDGGRRQNGEIKVESLSDKMLGRIRLGISVLAGAVAGYGFPAWHESVKPKQAGARNRSQQVQAILT